MKDWFALQETCDELKARIAYIEQAKSDDATEVGIPSIVDSVSECLWWGRPEAEYYARVWIHEQLAERGMDFINDLCHLAFVHKYIAMPANRSFQDPTFATVVIPALQRPLPWEDEKELPEDDK